MIIGYARVSTTEQNLGLRHDELKPARDASVDVTDARRSAALSRPQSRRTPPQRGRGCSGSSGNAQPNLGVM